MIEYWKPFVTVVIKKDDKILSLKRAKGNYYGESYDLPGGKMEFGENIYQAIQREVKEEIGVNIEKEKFTLKDVITWIDDEKEKKRFAICSCFLLNIEENIDIKLSKEHTKYEWLNKDNNKIDDFIRNIINICIKEDKDEFKK